MQENTGLYCNPQGVEFSCHQDNSIIVACKWPGLSDEEEYSLELSFYADHLEQFAEVFEIYSADQISSIHPDYLLLLYHQHQAVVTCMIDSGISPNLTFKKQPNNVLIIADPGNIIHEVEQNFDTPLAFKNYTYTYFRSAHN